MKALTDSGAGVWVEPADPGADDFVDSMRAHLDTHRFAVLRGGIDSLEDAVALMRRFGPINEAQTRTEGAVIVDSGGENEVFRSNGALPLHKDGILTGFDVRIVGIYCVHFQGVQGGRTYVSDANRALALVPDADVEILRTNGGEGMAVDATGYYRSEYTAVWHPFPAFLTLPGREPSLALGLPHAPGEAESWRVRVAGVDEVESDRILQNLRNAFLDDGHVYYHDWAEGDLILMDNYAVLHGREAFEAEKRALANIQVLGS